MKSDVMPSIVQMEPDVLKNLVKEVQETLAKDLVIPGDSERTFTAADLWNIRRNARTARGRFAR